MIVKKEFNLLRGVDNILHLPASTIKRIEIERGPRLIFVVLDLMKTRINHYTKKKVLTLISGLKARKQVQVVNLPSYNLHISYNVPTKGMIINLSAFGVTDISATKPGPIDLYASLVYGITFSSLVSGEVKINVKYAEVISSFLHSLLMRAFAKEYGLLGSFTSQIPKLQFLTIVYVLASFFGVTGITAYKRASSDTTFDYREVVDKLKRYDFSNINDFILALSDLEVFPNINKHVFTAKIMNKYTANFLPALEDLSRFIATLTAAEIKGTTIVPAYIYKYDERSYNNIIEISKSIFKRK